MDALSPFISVLLVDSSTESAHLRGRDVSLSIGGPGPHLRKNVRQVNMIYKRAQC